jgi:Sec-independent protein translocase protein TatA
MFTGLLQPTHLIILPDAGRALGQGLREFKNSIGGEHDEDRGLPAQATVTPEEKAPSR